MPSKRSRGNGAATWDDYRSSYALAANDSAHHTETWRRIPHRGKKDRDELSSSQSQSSDSLSEEDARKQRARTHRGHSSLLRPAKPRTICHPILAIIIFVLVAGVAFVGSVIIAQSAVDAIIAPSPKRFGGHVPGSLHWDRTELEGRVLDAKGSMSHALVYKRNDVEAIRGLVQRSSVPSKKEALGHFDTFMREAKAAATALSKFEARLPQVLSNVRVENRLLHKRVLDESEAGVGKSSLETLRKIIEKATTELGTLAGQAVGEIHSQLMELEYALGEIQEIVNEDERRGEKNFEENLKKSLKSGAWSRLDSEGEAQRQQIKNIREELMRIRQFVSTCQKHVSEVTRRLDTVTNELNDLHMRQSELVIDQARPDELYKVLLENKHISAKLERTLKNIDELDKINADIDAGTYKGDYFALPRWVPFE
ncbi:uncharacterized protein BDZ99DRAFT_576303 [Mytilinidion resinicola]|uniref:Uncharacterized protein n=1 Tax=Mytilinidion resinicola TaxID=574789 RepID=A0A6A6Y6J6_9PEZI|nr:uncharacterized protein BDZ99DRAFT_576303 [Mytilinidion resinicola]KAF2803427.1 hypothetical protein BDZ99DRAFT_576303 [Mytilinidion resinicola]